ncbi:hypothetical protein SRHO_G00303140 [Serrasalmus rhombeus]
MLETNGPPVSLLGEKRFFKRSSSTSGYPVCLATDPHPSLFTIEEVTTLTPEEVSNLTPNARDFTPLCTPRFSPLFLGEVCERKACFIQT